MELSRAYARAVDRGDVDGFVSLFTEDATLRLTAPGDPASVTHTIRGHEELAAVPRRMKRYHRSFHLVGQATYGDDGHGPTGEVYCIAHHLTVRPGTTEEDLDGAPEGTAENLVLYVRYADRYRRGSGDLWLIADRLVQVDWTETRPAHLPADAHRSVRGEGQASR